MAYHTTDPIKVTTEIVPKNHKTRAPGYYYEAGGGRYRSINYPNAEDMAKAIAARFPDAKVDGKTLEKRFPDVFKSAADVEVASKRAAAALANVEKAKEEAAAVLEKLPADIVEKSAKPAKPKGKRAAKQEQGEMF